MNTELQKAVQRVKRNSSDDFTRLYNFASAWIKTQKQPFTSEDLKKAFYEAKNEPLKNLNCFGAVMNTLSSEKAIHKNGYVSAKCKAAHARVIAVWISTDFRLKQQANRLALYKQQTSLPI